MSINSEFRINNAYPYNQSSPRRWIASHLWRYRGLLSITLLCFSGAWVVYSQAQVQIGRAINAVLNPGSDSLTTIAVTILLLLIADGLCMLSGYYAAETVAARFEADARQELYESLLGKSKNFHDQQRVGDMMARATDDTNQLSNFVVPGGTLVLEAVIGFIVPLVMIITVKAELVLFPFIYVVLFAVLVRRYLARLNPVIAQQREQYGKVNAVLEETISGIEVVKASAREQYEQTKFRNTAYAFRNLFVQQGDIESRYLPLLVYGFSIGATLLHSLWVYQAGTASLGQVVAVMGLMGLLRFPTFITVFAFSTTQSGLAGAGRILRIITSKTTMDENPQGHRATIEGEVIFDKVSFYYQNNPNTSDTQTTVENPLHREVTHQSPLLSQAQQRNGSDDQALTAAGVLNQVSLRINPGQTVAIVGQTGSGKTALTQLVNRTYDVSSGRVLIDGVDVRQWSLDALRSQIGRIEQDIFLFSRSIGENIAFGKPGASQAEIEAAARAAQAHDFIAQLPDGYATIVGERGMTLSGGQRQRVALARAFLSNPRILILDDSTSAIDSATEDEIQKAIRQMQQGRTTLLITHRISQIRWADLIVVLDQGRIEAVGTHEQLLRRSPHYRRIFARYDADLPPLEESTLVGSAAV